MRTWSTQRDRKEGKDYLLYKQEVYSKRVLLNFIGEEVLCVDMACPEIVTLFVFLYYIPHFQNKSTEVYVLESNVNRKVS